MPRRYKVRTKFLFELLRVEHNVPIDNNLHAFLARYVERKIIKKFYSDGSVFIETRKQTSRKTGTYFAMQEKYDKVMKENPWILNWVRSRIRFDIGMHKRYKKISDKSIVEYVTLH